MKLSAYHKAWGDNIYLNFPLQPPDITYASCIFTWNAKRRIGLSPKSIVGGSGIDLKTELPPEAEHSMPDYSLYTGVDFSLGFTSRGCIRKCPWCLVHEKEGGIRAVARIYEFWNRQHRKILLLDNNLLAASNWRQTMEDLIAEGLEVDFNQGLDIRLVNEESVSFLKLIKAKQLRFSFDEMVYEKALRKGIELMTDQGIRSRKLLFYVLVGYDGDRTAVERMKILASYNVNVYPMAYRGSDGKEPQRRILKGMEDLPLLHGPRRNIDKFLRLVGRLPE